MILDRHVWMVMHILYSHITAGPTTHTFCYSMRLQTKWNVPNVDPSRDRGFFSFNPTIPLSHSALLSVFMNIMNETTYSRLHTLVYTCGTHTHSYGSLQLLWGESNCWPMITDLVRHHDSSFNLVAFCRKNTFVENLGARLMN